MRHCKYCKKDKPKSHFKRWARKCNDCEHLKASASAKGITNMDRKLRELSAEVRYKNAVRVPGYKFKGEIPPPKSVDYYRIV